MFWNAGTVHAPSMCTATADEQEVSTVLTSIIRSGYSSLILLISRVPIPEPVPPPREWQTWKPACIQSCW